MCKCLFRTSIKDPPHLICVVVKVDKEKGLYQLGNKLGILNNGLPGNGFGLCKQSFIEISQVDISKTLSIREMARQSSLGNGQGFIKCGCKTGLCDKNCTCKKAGQLCNSRCHGRESNKNCKNK